MKQYIRFLGLLIMSCLLSPAHYAQADEADDAQAVTRSHSGSHEQPFTLAAGQGAGSALLTFVCAAGTVLTASNGLANLSSDFFSSFVLLNCTALFFYTALQSGLYSMSKFKRCSASFLKGKPCTP